MFIGKNISRNRLGVTQQYTNIAMNNGNVYERHFIYQQVMFHMLVPPKGDPMLFTKPVLSGCWLTNP
jgi:hypothetical protein